MENRLLRLFFIEWVGTFGLVFFSAGLVCMNGLAAPETATQSSPIQPLTSHQPGLVGIALGQGLILAALLALTGPLTGGYLNPALTLMQWVYNRVETPRAATLMGAQMLGGVVAAGCLHFTFDASLLQHAHYGAPQINPLVYAGTRPALLFTGTALEMLLTFFLALAIFGITTGDPLRLGLIAGMIATVCVLFGFPLTGAALNPARWFGPTLLDAIQHGRSAWNDTLVYLAGPIIGALLGGFFVFKVYGQDKK